MQKMSRLIFFIILVHIILIVYAAYYMSNESWAFIAGGLFYIIFGVLVLMLVIASFLSNKIAKKKELEEADTNTTDVDKSELEEIDTKEKVEKLEPDLKD